METNGKFYLYDGLCYMGRYDRDREFVEVIGCRRPPGLFPGYEGLDLFIHRGIRCPDWFVSEGKTGLRLSHGASVMEACIAAEELLKRFGLQTFMDRIEAAIKITGLSPRYAGAGEPAVTAAPHPPSENTSSAEILGDSHPEASNKIMGPSSDLPGCG